MEVLIKIKLFDILKMEGIERGETEFNMAVMTLNRVNYSLVVCSEFRRNKDMNGWFFELQNLYIETSTEMKGNLNAIVEKYTSVKTNIDKETTEGDTDEYTEVENLIDKIEPLLNTWNNKPSPNQTRILFKHLMVMEMLLRKVLKNTGILMKMKEDLFTPTQNWD